MKIRNLILGLVAILTLSSCNKKPDEKIFIESKYNQTTTVELSHDELKDKLDGEDFVLYVYTKGCSDCTYFHNTILNPFIEDTGAVIYSANITAIDDLIRTPKKYSLNPRICIFSNGEIIHQECEDTNEEIFQSKDAFASYINEKCIISSMKEVNYQQLTDLYESNKTSSQNLTVYFKLKGCRDCAYFEEKVLNPYLKEHHIENFVVYEANEFRDYKTESGDGENEELYNDFIDLFDINIKNNRGKFPTLTTYKNGARTNYCVYFNDELEYNDTNKTYTVLNTPYEDDSIVGKTFASYEEYQKQTESFHTSHFIEFMEDIK